MPDPLGTNPWLVTQGLRRTGTRTSEPRCFRSGCCPSSTPTGDHGADVWHDGAVLLVLKVIRKESYTGSMYMYTQCLQILLHSKNEMHFNKHWLYHRSKCAGIFGTPYVGVLCLLSLPVYVSSKLYLVVVCSFSLLCNIQLYSMICYQVPQISFWSWENIR